MFRLIKDSTKAGVNPQRVNKSIATICSLRKREYISSLSRIDLHSGNF